MPETKTETPTASRPYIAHEEYGIPKTMKGTLPWSHVTERLAKAKNYWISTVDPDGSPHTRAVWGIWVDDTLYFGGGPETKWSRNLAADPRVEVHLESADDVLILQGTVGRITGATDPRMTRIDDAYEAKYKMRHGIPVWVLRPTQVIAWNEFPKNATRWRFD
jgi:hypothetical protein